MSGWVAAVLAALGFMLLVVLHELGHFIAAKRTGMRVERFALFFPPLILKKRKGETEYGLGAIPLGGYVKITGMNPEEELPPEVAQRAYYNQPVWKRIVVIGAGPAMNLAVAFVLLFALAFGAVKATDQPIVGQVRAGTGASGALEPDDRILAVDGKRGDQAELAGQFDRHRCAPPQEEGCEARTPASVLVLRDGERRTVEVRPEYEVSKLERMRLGFTYADSGTDATTVASVDPNTPAAGVLVTGDQIVSVDGKKGDQTTLRSQVSEHACASGPTDGCKAATPAVVVVRRDGRLRTVEIYPRYYESVGYMVPGFAFGKPLNPTVIGAASDSINTMWKITTGTVGAIVRIFQPEQRKQLSSVVGSYEYTRHAIQADWRLGLTLLAVVSLALAIINLFPFLPLDGGHIFWSLVEKARGSPVPFRVMERASAMGFVLVLMLFAIGLTNDIGRLTGDGFGVR